MMTFDRCLQEVVRICDQHEDARHVETIVLVRDIRGCVRLVLKPKESTFVPSRLEAALGSGLGDYFKGILLTSARSPDERRLAMKLLEVSQPWETGSRTGLWRKIERRISKQMWLEHGSPAPPWKLERGRPAIVTFYSFKGGVGRTTAMASCAWQLAQQGKRVCVIDLDLEAPGLSNLFEVSTDRGTIDFVVDFLATDQRDIDGCHSAALGIGTDAERVEVVPAGRVDMDYVEKLARLDFTGAQILDENRNNSPVERALRALLHAVAALRFDYIFLDSRAGLHDLAGLSLHGLAHVDVLFARASEQSYTGLEIAARAMALRRQPEEMLTIVVHTFAPRDLESDVGRAEVEAFRQRAYQIFLEHIYLEQDAPGLEDSSAAHMPIVVRADTNLERFSRLVAVKGQLLSGDYLALCRRIEELCTASFEEGEEE